MTELQWLLEFEKEFYAKGGNTKEDLHDMVLRRIEKLRLERTKQRMSECDDFRDILRLCGNLRKVVKQPKIHNHENHD